MLIEAGDEGSKLGMIMDSCFELGCLDAEILIAGAIAFEQGRAKVRADFPIVVQGVDVPSRDTAIKMAADVLDILCFLSVNVARQIEIEVVLFDLVVWD